MTGANATGRVSEKTPLASEVPDKVRWEAKVQNNHNRTKAHNSNLAVRNNVGARKPEDHKNEGDRATPQYVYLTGIRKGQGAEVPSYRNDRVDTKARRIVQQEPTCLIMPEGLRRTGNLQPIVELMKKKKYVRQYIETKKGKEIATGECRVGNTTKSERERSTVGQAVERTISNSTPTRSKREEVRAN